MKKTLVLMLLLAGLTLEAQGRTLTWTGKVGSGWNKSDANWVNESGDPAVYQDGDAVVFADSDRTIVKSFGNSPASVLVENSEGCNYTFETISGRNDGLMGAMSLTKKGDGNLSLNDFNSYEGNTYIHGGIVTIQQAGSLGSGTVYLHGGGLYINSLEGLANNVIVDGNASLGGRIGDGELTLCENSRLTVNNFLIGSSRDAIIKDGATLDLAARYIKGYAGGMSFGVIRVGNSSIGNGEIRNCRLNVEAGKTLTLLANTSATSGTVFNLGEGATLNLGGNSVNFGGEAGNQLSLSGSADIGNGTITGNLTVAAGKQINLLADTSITGGVSLEDGAIFNLGGNSVNFGGEASNRLSLSGSTTIGNGTIEAGDIVVDSGNTLTLCGDLKGDGKIYLGENATLNLGEHTLTNKVYLTDAPDGTYTSASIGNGTIEGGLTVAGGQTLRLCGDLTGSGSIDLGQEAVLDLGGYTLGKDVTLTSAATKATLGNGTLDSNVYVQGDKTLWLGGNLSGKGTILLNGGRLNLGWQTLSNNVLVEGMGEIGDGKFNGTLTVADKATLTISGKMDGSGTIILGEGASLYLEDTLSNNVELSGSSAYMGGPNYAFCGNLSLGAGKTLTLTRNLKGGINGSITLGAGSTLDLGWNTLSVDGVTVTGNNATISNGVYYGNLNVAKNVTLTLPKEGLTLSKTVILADNATLDLGGGSLSTSISLDGSSTSIGNGAITSALNVLEGKTLKLCGNLDGSGSIILGENATLNLGTHSLSNSVTLNGTTTSIGNGTFNGNLAVGSGNTLKLCGNLGGTGTVSLGENATLNLGTHSLSNSVTLNGTTTSIGNGTLNNSLAVGTGNTLKLCGNLGGSGTVSLGENATLNLGANTISSTISVNGSSASIGNGTIEGSVTAGTGATLTFFGKTHIGGSISSNCTISLANNATLDLGTQNVSNNITLSGSSASISGTSFNGILDVGADKRLTLCGDLGGGWSINLGNRASLDLNGHTLSQSIILQGNAFIGGGVLNGNVHCDTKLPYIALIGDLSGSGTIFLSEKSSVLLLKGHTLSNPVSLHADTVSIGGGTYNGKLSVLENKTLSLCGDLSGSGIIDLCYGATLKLNGHTLSKDVTLTGSSTVTAGNTTVKALNTDKKGLLQGLSVSDGLIAGTDRLVSRADGLKIESEANLMIKSMTLTANNSISVGNHTITLNNVTIKMSDDIPTLEDGIYYFDLKSLINCDLAMQNVLLDASALTLPQDFDPANKSVVFDFGDDVTIQKPTGLDMRLGDYWATSMSLDQPGKVVFKNLVETPEPATGTLSLLALAALCTRRRRK